MITPAIFLLLVPSAEVEMMQNGSAIAGETSFFLSCCVTLAENIQNDEKLKIKIVTPFTSTDTENQSDESMSDDNCMYTSVLQFTTLKTSHGGEYTCTVMFNSSTIASNTTTVKVQSKF